MCILMKPHILKCALFIDSRFAHFNSRTHVYTHHYEKFNVEARQMTIRQSLRTIHRRIQVRHTPRACDSGRGQQATGRKMFTRVRLQVQASIDSNSEYETAAAPSHRSVLFRESKKKTSLFTLILCSSMNNTCDIFSNIFFYTRNFQERISFHEPI